MPPPPRQLSWLTAIALIALLIAACGGDEPDPLTVGDTDVLLTDFPASFAVEARANRPVAAAILQWRTIPGGEPHQTVAIIDPDDPAQFRAQIWTLQAGDRADWLPPGSDIEWFWRVVGQTGGVLDTLPTVWRFDDPRFRGVTIPGDQVEIVQYGGSAFAVGEWDGVVAAARTAVLQLLDASLDAPTRIAVWYDLETAGGAHPWGVDGLTPIGLELEPRMVGPALVYMAVQTPPLVDVVAFHVAAATAAAVFGEDRHVPPAWLQSAVASRAAFPDGPNYRHVVSLRILLQTDSAFSVADLDPEPTEDWQIEAWFAEGLILVWWLLDHFDHALFPDFAAALTGGATVETALRDVYDLSAADFDSQFLAQAADYIVAR